MSSAQREANGKFVEAAYGTVDRMVHNFIHHNNFYQEHRDKNDNLILLGVHKIIKRTINELTLGEGIRTGYHPTGQLRFNAKCSAGLSNGECTYYHKNGNKSVVYNMVNDKRHGQSIEYSEDGLKLASFNWLDDQKQGLAVHYYPNGQIKKQGMMVNGLTEGPITEYYLSSLLKMTGFYKKGKKDGTFVYYKEDGSFDRIEEYHQDQLVVDDAPNKKQKIN